MSLFIVFLELRALDTKRPLHSLIFLNKWIFLRQKRAHPPINPPQRAFSPPPLGGPCWQYVVGVGWILNFSAQRLQNQVQKQVSPFQSSFTFNTLSTYNTHNIHIQQSGHQCCVGLWNHSSSCILILVAAVLGYSVHPQIHLWKFTFENLPCSRKMMLIACSLE